jgi:hypothetical protein
MIFANVSRSPSKNHNGVVVAPQPYLPVFLAPFSRPCGTPAIFPLINIGDSQFPVAKPTRLPLFPDAEKYSALPISQNPGPGMPVQAAEADCGLNHSSFVSCPLRSGSYLYILGRTERAKKTRVTVLHRRNAQFDFVLHFAPPSSISSRISSRISSAGRIVSSALVYLPAIPNIVRAASRVSRRLLPYWCSANTTWSCRSRRSFRRIP